MSLSTLLPAKWSALRAVACDEEIALGRLPPTGDAPLPPDLDLWLDDTLLPTLQKRLPGIGPYDVLAAAGLTAWLNPAKTPPSAATIAQIEQAIGGALDDPPAPPGSFISPVKMTESRRKADTTKRQWQPLVQRLLAFAGGWARDIGSGPWEDIWERAVTEFAIVSRQPTEKVLKKLWRTAYGVKDAVCPRMGSVPAEDGCTKTPDYLDYLFDLGLAAVQRFLTSLPPGASKGERFRHLEGWNPAQGSLYGWITTLLEGGVNKGKKIQHADDFGRGALGRVLKEENFIAVANTGWRICWSEECRTREFREERKRARRPFFEIGPCPDCKAPVEHLSVVVDQVRIFSPDEYEEHRFSRCSGSKPDHFVLLREGQKASDAKCPIHPESECSQGETMLWLQMKRSDDDLPSDADGAPPGDATPAAEMLERYADPTEEAEP
jgi:hypothetical protein